MILNGKLVASDRRAATTISRKSQQIDLWYSGKGHRFGGNIQAVMRPDGLPVWVSDVEPGSVHDLVAAHEHALGALYAAAARGLPTPADGGYEGAGHGVHTPYKQPADGHQLALDHRAYNMLLRSYSPTSNTATYLVEITSVPRIFEPPSCVVHSAQLPHAQSPARTDHHA